jgi:hypothetical protein
VSSSLLVELSRVKSGLVCGIKVKLVDVKVNLQNVTNER